MEAYARIAGNIDPEATSYSWYSGRLIGVRPGGAGRNLMGIIGMGSVRILPLADQPGYQMLRKELGFFTDLSTGAVLDADGTSAGRHSICLFHWFRKITGHHASTNSGVGARALSRFSDRPHASLAAGILPRALHAHTNTSTGERAMTPSPNRRRFLQSGVCATLAIPLTMGMSSAQIAGFAPVSSLDALTPLECFTRLRCSQPGDTTTWWYSGHMLGKVDGDAAVPILSLIGASQSKIEYLKDDTVRYSLIEAGYYGDPDTGEIADGPIINRITSAPMTPKHYLSPQSLDFFSDRTIRPAEQALPANTDFSGRMVGPDVKAGRVWMAEELFVKVPATANRGERVLTSLANFQGLATAIWSPVIFGDLI